MKIAKVKLEKEYLEKNIKSTYDFTSNIRNIESWVESKDSVGAHNWGDKEINYNSLKIREIEGENILKIIYALYLNVIPPFG